MKIQMEKLPDKLITDYAHGFYGYGSGKAKIWFVGMEEGGGGIFEDVIGRLDAWNELGRNKLQDLRRLHLARNDNHPRRRGHHDEAPRKDLRGNQQL